MPRASFVSVRSCSSKPFPSSWRLRSVKAGGKTVKLKTAVAFKSKVANSY